MSSLGRSLALVVAAWAASANAQSASRTRTATIEFRNPHDDPGYEWASVEVRYRFLDCFGQIALHYSIDRASFRFSPRYVHRRRARDVPSNFSQPVPSSVELTGRAAYRGEIIQLIYDGTAGEHGGAGCYGQTKTVAKKGALGDDLDLEAFTFIEGALGPFRNPDLERRWDDEERQRADQEKRLEAERARARDAEAAREQARTEAEEVRRKNEELARARERTRRDEEARAEAPADEEPAAHDTEAPPAAPRQRTEEELRLQVAVLSANADAERAAAAGDYEAAVQHALRAQQLAPSEWQAAQVQKYRMSAATAGALRGLSDGFDEVNRDKPTLGHIGVRVRSAIDGGLGPFGAGLHARGGALLIWQASLEYYKAPPRQMVTALRGTSGTVFEQAVGAVSYSEVAIFGGLGLAAEPVEGLYLHLSAGAGMGVVLLEALRGYSDEPTNAYPVHALAEAGVAWRIGGSHFGIGVVTRFQSMGVSLGTNGLAETRARGDASLRMRELQFADTAFPWFFSLGLEVMYFH